MNSRHFCWVNSMKDRKKPAIRFKGFTEDWEQRKLGEMMEVTSVKRILQSDWADSGVRFLRARDIVADQKNEKIVDPLYISKEKYDDYSAISGKVKIGDLLVTGVGTIGASMLIKTKKPLYFKDGNIIWFKNENKIEGYFFYYSFNADVIQNFIKESAGIGTVGTYTIESGKKTPIYFPLAKEEQEVIGTFFSNLDNLITLHQRKYDKLVNVKKSMLEKIFPKNGESIPDIRFSGFTEDWEHRKLSELCFLVTKGTTPLDKSSIGTVNFVKIESIDEVSGEIKIMQKITDEEHNGYLRRSQLKKGDILFSIAGTLGRVTAVKSGILPANTNQALAIIRLKSGCLQYIKTYLKGKAVADFIKENPTIGAQPNLSLEQVGNLEISLPTENEQKFIGSYFQHLDNLITLHQRKLEKLKNIKKSCLEKMFI